MGSGVGGKTGSGTALAFTKSLGVSNSLLGWNRYSKTPAMRADESPAQRLVRVSFETFLCVFSC